MRFIPVFTAILTACLLCIDTTSGLSFRCFTAPILAAFLISWPTIYLPRIPRIAVQMVIGELVILICLVDCYCQEYFATPITPQILSNVLLSNMRETGEFFGTFVNEYTLTHWRIDALLLLAVVLPVSLVLLRKPITVNKVLKRVGLVIIILCLICEASPAYNYSRLFFQGGNTQNMEGLIFRHYHEEIPTPIHRLAFACYSIKQSERVLEDIKRSTFSASIDRCSHRSPHIVLIIGESYNKHHSTLYGYKLSTTPLQQKRIDEGELWAFTDVVTPWNITSNVFLDMFSVWEYGSKKTVGKQPLFPILFRRAGYDVNFFSNQYILRGFRKGSTNQAGHFFLADGEMSDSLFTFRNKRSRSFDMGLVEQVLEYKHEHPQATYTLDIIHLVGQHFDYSERYPESEARFSVDDYADRTIDEEAKNIVMHYDNATHYNDMVLDSILSMYEHEEAIVLCVADHGEEAYDDMQIHGRLFQEPTASQARYEFEVPMWIWCSESYRQRHEDVVCCIEQSIDKPFMTDRIPQILLSLGGISCQWTDDTHNLLSPKYKSSPRIICGSVEYDYLMNR